MMTKISMKRFSIKNLDCASCAAKIENGLKRVEGVDGNYAGYITIGDEIKPDADNALKALKKQGVEHIAMPVPMSEWPWGHWEAMLPSRRLMWC